MALFRSDSEANLAAIMAEMSFVNPFLPRRIELERAVLGEQFVDAGADWNVRTESGAEHPNIERLQARLAELLGLLQPRLAEGVTPDPAEVKLYEALVMLELYYRYRHEMQDLIHAFVADPGRRPAAPFYERFAADARQLGDLPGCRLPMVEQLPMLFASFFQVRRAFFEIFNNIIGVSEAVVRLRATVWRSLFSHDLQRYRRVLHKRMNDVTTLIVGPSGTGKELVARAIALSRFVPFDAKARTFVENYTTLFHPLNVSALSPTLVESELFGHVRGSFTGAVRDRAGWLAVSSTLGAVFLDEIGDLDPQIQVKLLRVLETRRFQPLGSTQTRQFEGKIIAATNRDLDGLRREGRFREDFYYRLCSDVIHTPMLVEQLRNCPQQLRALTGALARRLIGPEEADELSEEVVEWIEANLGEDYPWPGNVRELGQCVCNIMVHHAYRPLAERQANGSGDEARRLTDAMAAGELTLDELANAYCTLAYARAGSYEAAAKKLGVDRRTVRSRVDRDLLGRLR